MGTDKSLVRLGWEQIRVRSLGGGRIRLFIQYIGLHALIGF